MRTCFHCKIEKPFTEFYRSNTRYYQRECKECTRDRRHHWWKTAAGKASSRATKLKTRFGITVNDYESRLTEQNRQCAICGAETSYMGHRLTVDHCHTTGKIRGLLCKACNVGIGNFQDSVERIHQAAIYLIKNGVAAK